MVDRLKQSVENLESPTCADCHVAMKWYRSVLTQEAEPQTIVHYFHCPNCSRLQEQTTLLVHGQAIDPTKLSMPRRGFSCAA